MPFYNDLRPFEDFTKRDFALVFPEVAENPAWKARAIDGLLRLKTALDGQVSRRQTEANLLVASWNIKEFGHTTQRLPEAYFYIAEILSRFDLVAVQEVKSTLKDLDIVMRILGSKWDYIVNDITEGVQGNSERSAYLYNTDRVKLSGLAGEIVLWPELTGDSPVQQLKRTPYATGFKAGWKSFAMLNLHLHPGDEIEDLAFRKEEVRLLLAALEEKIDQPWTRNIVLCGDFNLHSGDDDSTVEAINDMGYCEVDGLVGKQTNDANTQVYDRLFYRKNPYFKLIEDSHGKSVGGVFNPFEFVYRFEDHLQYKQDMIAVYGGSRNLESDAEALRDYFLHYWRRNQISDHLPIWFELQTDSSVEFLEFKRSQLQDPA